MSFASTTLVGPEKHLLHIADRFGRILYCVHSTQYSLLVTLVVCNILHANFYTNIIIRHKCSANDSDLLDAIPLLFTARQEAYSDSFGIINL